LVSSTREVLQNIGKKMALLWILLGLIIQDCNGQKIIGSRLLTLHDEMSSYEDAVQACESKQSKLLRVDTKEIYEWVTAQGVVWLNGKAENDLKWNDDSPVDGFVAHLLPEEAGQFCFSANDISGRFTVKDCDIEQAFVCELSLEGYDIVSGRAVKYFDELVNWEAARDACHALPTGGHLLTVDNDEIHDWLHQKSEETWIGLNDRDEENVWTWESGANYDNTKVGSGGQNRFYNKEPNNSGGDENCVEANFSSDKTKWNDLNCTTKERRYACEINI